MHREKYQAEAIGTINDSSLWCCNMINQGRDLDALHPTEVYRLAEMLTGLKWAIAAWQANADDVENILAELRQLTDKHPEAPRLAEALRDVETAVNAYLAWHFGLNESAPSPDEIQACRERIRRLGLL